MFGVAVARRRWISLGGILSGRPEIRAAILYLLVALALGLTGGYLLARRFPPAPGPPPPAAPDSGMVTPLWACLA
jgi:hypothetical protein